MAYIPTEKLRALCEGFEGICSVYLSVPSSGEVFTFNADQKMNSASTIKTPILALLLKDAEEGRLDLEEPLPLGEEGPSAGSGVLKFLSPQLQLSLYDYATLMMIYSDNTATNKVIDTVGMERANTFFAENGWKETHLARKMTHPLSQKPNTPVATNYTSARDQGSILTQILEKRLVSEAVSEKMLSIMTCQQLGKMDKALPTVWRHAYPRKPLTEIPEGRVALAQKGGTLSKEGISHDTAIMLFPNGQSAVLAVLTESKDPQKAAELIGAIARTVYDSLRRERNVAAIL